MTVVDQTGTETGCECCGGRLVWLFDFKGKPMFRCRDCGHDQSAR